MSDGHPSRLADCPSALETLLPIMERMYQPPNLSAPEQMMEEKNRLKLAKEAGKHEVLQDFRRALELAYKERNKPRVREEIV